MTTFLLIAACCTALALICGWFGFVMANILSDVLECVGDAILAKLGR